MQTEVQTIKDGGFIRLFIYLYLLENIDYANFVFSNGAFKQMSILIV